MSQAPYTTYASSVMALTELVVSRMNRAPIGAGRKVVLQEPVGPSTSGGKAARQSIMLTNSDGEAAVCGWVDFVTTAASVKDFRSMAESYQARYGRPFDLTENQYRAFHQRLNEVLAEFKITALLVSDELADRVTEPGLTRGRPPGAETQRAPSLILVAAIFLLLGIASTLVVLAALHR